MFLHRDLVGVVRHQRYLHSLKIPITPISQSSAHFHYFQQISSTYLTHLCSGSKLFHRLYSYSYHLNQMALNQEAHKARIEVLYKDEDMALEDVMARMKEEFKVTAR
jgi:hypothetical protein